MDKKISASKIPNNKDRHVNHCDVTCTQCKNNTQCILCEACVAVA